MNYPRLKKRVQMFNKKGTKYQKEETERRVRITKGGVQVLINEIVV